MPESEEYHGEEQILVLTFFRRSVAPIKEFLKSQGLYPRVEHVDSERIKDGPNAVVIIDVPTSDIVNPYTGDHLSDSRRNEKALVLPSSLRIVVGREDLGQSNDFFAPSTKPSYGESFWLNFVTHHMRQGMVKSVNVGDRILKYERDLESKNYWMVSEYRTEASEMFDAVRFDEEDEDTSIPLVEAGEAGVERLSDHDIERHERSSSVEAGFEISSFDHDAETDQSPQSVMDGNIWKRKELALGSSELNETPSASYDEGSKYGNDIDKLDRIKKSNWR
ncbi:uncharacterized protein LY89DRAFT_692222 [Mollisia scopiformis]|uniref:Uncharacterized protein n=1 Tax=Mollisia scopiformis TaxID=149040 RepID=A0A132B5C0_MOLSC|nr:uncharacterized protein LY89DRAFT_692222 [Mollisia scopiformis]KUJ06867.1 hypothetical protein LY89DRAFT_692222 [Mollisia scopiformis]